MYVLYYIHVLYRSCARADGFKGKKDYHKEWVSVILFSNFYGILQVKGPVLIQARSMDFAGSSGL